MANKIYVLDFGNKYADDYVAYIKDKGYKVDKVDRNISAKDIAFDDELRGLVLAGGHYTVYDDDLEVFDQDILQIDTPIFAIGRGMQVMLASLGGVVEPVGEVHDPSPAQLTIHNTDSGLFIGVINQQEVQLGYDAAVRELPANFEVVANGPDRPFGAVENKAQGLYGIQFELDIENDDLTQQVFNNFIHHIVEDHGN